MIEIVNNGRPPAAPPSPRLKEIQEALPMRARLLARIPEVEQAEQECAAAYEETRIQLENQRLRLEDLRVHLIAIRTVLAELRGLADERNPP